MLWNLILFAAVFLYITNWSRLRLVFRGLLRPKKSFSNFTDKQFIDKVNKKTGFKFNILIQESDWIFGYMPSIPIKPVMVISSGARKYLTNDELEWIVLHEAGHCIQWHVVKMIIAGLVILLLGVTAIYYFKIPMLIIPIYALVLAIFYYQIERGISERPADIFSLNRISNPQGMMTANRKMKQRVTSLFYKNKILTKLFTGSLGYDQRIEMAKKKLKQI